MMRFLFFLFFLSSFSFSHIPVYYSASDWLNRTFPSSLFSNVNFSGVFAANESNKILISQRGALYFLHISSKYDNFDSAFSFNDHFLKAYNFYSPSSAYGSVYTLVPDNFEYFNIFADNLGGDLGILMKFQSLMNISDFDYSCLRSVHEVLKHSKGNLYVDSLSRYYNSPLVITVGEPCGSDGTNNKQKKFLKYHENNNIQIFEYLFYDKISEPCPLNHIFSGSPIKKDITCQPCENGKYADVFRNVCVSENEISSIENPYNYASAQCLKNGSTFKHIERVLGIINGGKNYFCETVCSDGKRYPNYNCPEKIDFDYQAYNECSEGDCSDSNETSPNMSSNFSPFEAPETPENNNSVRNDSELLKLKNKSGNEVCVDGTDKCFKVGDGKNTEICSSDDSGGKECYGLGTKENFVGNELCVDGDCFSVFDGPGNSKNTFSVDGQVFNSGGNSKISPGKICVGDHCTDFGDKNAAFGSQDFKNGLKTGLNDDAFSFIGNSDGSNFSPGSSSGICEDGSCGSYDNSTLSEYKSLLDKMGDSVGGFQTALMDQYNSFKESVESAKKIINGNILVLNPKNIRSCPLTFDLDFGFGIPPVEIRIDMCSFLSRISNLTYILFYLVFLFLAVKLSMKAVLFMRKTVFSNVS